MEAIRGRRLRYGAPPGLKGLTLSDFCDLVWAEVLDDCPPMGDHAQYRDIVHKMFIEGLEPHDIWWTDHDGKSHRLTEPARKKGVSGRPSKEQFAAAAALQEQLRAAREAAKQAGGEESS